MNEQRQKSIHDFAANAGTVIPVFQPELKTRERLDTALAHMDERKYTMDDVTVYSEWISICSMNFLIDDYKDKHGKKPSLQDHELYDGQCLPSATLSGIMLRRMGHPVIWVSTSLLCQDQLIHNGAIGRFDTITGPATVFYDMTLRQFFTTDEKGALKEDRVYGLNGDIVADGFLNEKPSTPVMNELLMTGAVGADDKVMQAYVRPFLISLVCHSKTFDPHKINATPYVGVGGFAENLGDYLPWAILPGEGKNAKVDAFLNWQDKLVP